MKFEVTYLVPKRIVVEAEDTREAIDEFYELVGDWVEIQNVAEIT